jgi:sigma-B regulation protein RsbU (phosphoserine phosphatase)
LACITWRLAREVGGDFYDFVPLEPGADGPRWGIAIADVADKGVPAALFMALSRTLLRSVAINRIDPGLTLTRLNNLIFNDAQANMFVSVFYAVWEPGTGRVMYANGGHNPPMVFEPGKRCCFLEEHQMVLGIEAGIDIKPLLTLDRGSSRPVYRRVSEASNAGEFFGPAAEARSQLRDWGACRHWRNDRHRVSDFCRPAFATT